MTIELDMPAEHPNSDRAFKGWATAWLPMFVLLVACAGESPEPTLPPTDAVATWNGGALFLPDLENALAEARSRACQRARRGGGIEELVSCYRELAEGLALEQLVLAEVADVEAAISDLEDYDQLRRHAYVETYLRQLQETIEIQDAEIELRFEADRARFQRPGSIHLANIFRRHADPKLPQETVKFLRALKERFEAGETFDALAREASHSETRLRGGKVGQVVEGKLPARLEKVAFGLGEGDVSDPILVKGGAVLLHVDNVIAGVAPTLAGAREQIRRELATERIQNMVSERVAGRELPANALTLEFEELIETLDSGDPERPVLEIDGDSLSVAELRRLAQLGTGLASEFDEVERDRLREVYFRQREQQLLALELVEAAELEQRDVAEEHLREEAVARWVENRLQDEIGQHIENDEATLRGYFEDNRHHYQSPLRFEVQIWSLPFGDDPPGQLHRMETLREQLTTGELDLAAAASQLGGSLGELGWQDFDAFTKEIPAKALTYLLEVGASGFSVPYQQGDALHLIELVQRQEPEPLDFEAARDRVRSDYEARFGQEVYGQIAEQRLGEAGFVFAEEVLRQLLAPPGDGPVSSADEGSSVDEGAP